MTMIDTLVSDGVLRITYDAPTRNVVIYYKNGQIDYAYGVTWSDYSAIASAAAPLATAQSTLSKYRISSGHR